MENEYSYIKEKFFCYKSLIPKLADKPFQVCTSFGCLVAANTTFEEAKATVDALQSAYDDGSLPYNLDKWDKASLYL